MKPKRKQKNVVKRMQFDVEKRENREKTFDEIKNTVIHSNHDTS